MMYRSPLVVVTVSPLTGGGPPRVIAVPSSAVDSAERLSPEQPRLTMNNEMQANEVILKKSLQVLHVPKLGGLSR